MRRPRYIIIGRVIETEREGLRSARAPIAFLVFNRPALTRHVFEAIAAARPSKLLVVGDGPRPDHPEDPGLVAETRAIVDEVAWPCEVRTCYAEANMGCRLRISSGLDWVFSQVDEAIILEDDTVPHRSLFQFCDAMLERYRSDAEIHQVSGSSPFPPHRFTRDSYYFARCYQIWGWATWARAWSHYDLQMRRWPEVRDTPWLEELLGGATEARIARDIFDATFAGAVPTWDFQWVFSTWLAGGMAIAPAMNLVTNIGYGEFASHEHNADHPNANRPAEPMDDPIRHPSTRAVLGTADRAMWEFTYPSYFGARHHEPRARIDRLVREAFGPHPGATARRR
jgi:hypothetical protein